jgi:hypothetical protein
MKIFRRARVRVIAAGAAMLMAGGIGSAVAAGGTGMGGHGVDEFGMTKAFFNGRAVDFTYSKGFYCDTSVLAASPSGCEAGAPALVPPAKNFDPLFITVPLGFKVPSSKMECPDGLVCVDHPATIDLSRLEPALKPLYPSLTDAQLTATLKNVPTPGHDHFITTRDGGRREWWDVQVVGVTSKAEYNKIAAHRSTAFLKKEIKAGKTTAAIPTNLFLFFSVQ